MTDIIERLRSPAVVFYEYAADDGALLKEAADEIERLREELAKAQKDAEKWQQHVARQRAPAHSCDIEGCAVCDPTYGL